MTARPSAPATVRETERKYESPAGSGLPDWTKAAAVRAVSEPVQIELDATYFDTADHRLLAAGITLRRRTGGDDAGWHAKIPAGKDSRDELRLPLTTAGRVPASLTGLLTGITLGADLVEVARIRTTRTEWSLTGRDGEPLASVAADQVAAEASHGADGITLDSWREVEVELAAGASDAAPLDALEKVLIKAGFERAGSASKLARVLGASTSTASLTKDSTARKVVLTGLRSLLATLRRHDLGVRRDLPDAVHQSRVTCRKLRAALKAYRAVLDRDRIPGLRRELQWYSHELGPARDTEVLAERLHDEVDSLPDELVLGPVQARLTAHFAREEATARDRVRAAIGSTRYLAMLADLEDLLRDPPRTTTGRTPARTALRKPVRTTWRRLAASVARAEELPDGAERDAAVHQARKDAKKARYAADIARPVFGGKLKHWRRFVKQSQRVLGTHQDAVVARGELRVLAVREHAEGGNAFTHGVVHARQDRQAELARQRFAEHWADQRPGSWPNWLT